MVATTCSGSKNDQNQISCYSIKFLVKQIADKVKENCLKCQFSR